MERRATWCTWLIGLVVFSLFVGHASIAVADPVFDRAPWADGEKASYVGLAPNGSAMSATEIRMRLHDGAWVLEEGKTQVDFTTDLFTARSSHASSAGQVEAVYGQREVKVTVTPTNGAAKETTVFVHGPAVDNDALLTALRALPLAAGYSATLEVVVPRSGASRLTVRVGEARKVTVPAGTFETFPVTLDFGVSAHHAYYAVEPPHWLIEYDNSATKGSLVLRSYQESPAAPPQGQLDPPVLPSREVPPPVSWEILVLACCVQYPLMIVFPAWLAFRVRKRTGLPHKVWGLGALAFVLSQMVHLPLNWALGLLGTPRGVALLPFPAYAAIVGLSAGVCEEVSRFLVLRFMLRDQRDDRASLLFGVGHGGIESVIVGILAGAGLLNMALVSWIGPKAIGVPPEAAKDVIGSALLYWNSNPLDFVLAGIERLGAIAFHVMASHLVMRAVARRRIGWLLLAVAAHAAFDGFAVASMKALGGYPTSAIFGALGLVCVAITLGLRRARAAKA